MFRSQLLWLTVEIAPFTFLGRTTLALAIPLIATLFSVVAWSVCLCLSLLSVVCHIRAPCLNGLTDLDAIWQVHLCGLMEHCVRLGIWSPEEGEIHNPQQKHAIANCCCHLAYRNEEWFYLFPNYFGLLVLTFLLVAICVSSCLMLRLCLFVSLQDDKVSSNTQRSAVIQDYLKSNFSKPVRHAL